MQAHLYHKLWLNKPANRNVVTEYPVEKRKGRGKRIDLAVLNLSGKPRLLIEIKETSSTGIKPETVANRIEEDIEKLTKVSKTRGTSHTRKPIQLFFFREETAGIEPELDAELKGLAKKTTTRFLWGPCR